LKATREAALRETLMRAAHDLIFERHVDLSDGLEVGPPTSFDNASSPATITFWNVERGRRPDVQAILMNEQSAAAHLLCELNLGMARTRQRHTARNLAERLRVTCAFGVEFLELGVGDRREQAAIAGETNQAGLHGAAILLPHPLARPTPAGWRLVRRRGRALSDHELLVVTIEPESSP
jgi:hypothetical protein